MTSLYIVRILMFSNYVKYLKFSKFNNKMDTLELIFQELLQVNKSIHL